MEPRPGGRNRLYQNSVVEINTKPHHKTAQSRENSLALSTTKLSGRGSARPMTHLKSKIFKMRPRGIVAGGSPPFASKTEFAPNPFRKFLKAPALISASSIFTSGAARTGVTILSWRAGYVAIGTKTRSSRRVLVSGACRSSYSRRKIGRHRSAWSPTIDGRNSGK
jgi:hypothetical protein